MPSKETQAAVEAVKTRTIQNALKRNLRDNKGPRIRQALEKLQERIRVAEHGEDPKATSERVTAWKARIAEYQESLKLIEEGSYHGANDLPFGANPMMEDLD